MDIVLLGNEPLLHFIFFFKIGSALSGENTKGIFYVILSMRKKTRSDFSIFDFQMFVDQDSQIQGFSDVTRFSNFQILILGFANFAISAKKVDFRAYPMRGLRGGQSDPVKSCKILQNPVKIL